MHLSSKPFLNPFLIAAGKPLTNSLQKEWNLVQHGLQFRLCNLFKASDKRWLMWLLNTIVKESPLSN